MVSPRILPASLLVKRSKYFPEDDKIKNKNKKTPEQLQALSAWPMLEFQKGPLHELLGKMRSIEIKNISMQFLYRDLHPFTEAFCLQSLSVRCYNILIFPLG